MKWVYYIPTQPTQKEVRDPFKWSKELKNEVDETKIQEPLGLFSWIYVSMSIEGDLQLARKWGLLDRRKREMTRDM